MMCGSHLARFTTSSYCAVSVKSECPLLCRVGSSDHYACVDGEIAALLGRQQSKVLNEELVLASCEVRTLFKAWSVEKLALRPNIGCSLVEHPERFFVAPNQSTMTQCSTAVVSVVHIVVVGEGAVMSTRLSRGVTVHPLMSNIFHECSADRLTEEIFR